MVSNVVKNLRSGFLFLDGAMGTMLQKRGLTPGERPELYVLTHPEAVTSIHREYVRAGAQVVYTNTFGANAHKMEGSGYTPEQVISAAVQCARDACAGSDCAVALDVGPLGELLEPAGTLSFHEAYALFRQQILAGVKAGVDLIVLETMTDLYEIKAALLAAKENSDLPVFATMTFEETGRTFTGCTASAMALTLEGLGADAIGINCSLGPAEIYPIVQELMQWTDLPVIVKANAGLPDPRTGAYAVTPEDFAREGERLADLGVRVLGGCCGTTPETIAALRRKLDQRLPEKRQFIARAAVCSMLETVEISGVRIIGERINPTGKKRFKQALKEGDIDYILTQGVLQTDAGADILDVNVGLPDIDERDMMVRVVKRLQSVSGAPLQLDSSDPQVLESALRVYNGKPIVNSVNGERRTLDAILPLVKKYGAAVVGLTLDESGIPSSAQGRFDIARRILESALSYGIRREDIYIDCLTLTVSAQQDQAAETLKAVRMVREELGLKTVLGVSNISFGLPNRELINQSFLMMAMASGLNLPIINPNVAAMTGAVAAYNVLVNHDVHAASFIDRFGGETASIIPSAASGANMQIEYAVLKGLCEESARIARVLLESMEPLEVVNARLIPALDDVGQKFEKGVLFLPQLLQAAQAAQAAFDVVKNKIAQNGSESLSKGKIVLATVKGDIHDIGKNIVKVILENYGYGVVDLGRDVPIQTVVEAARRHNAQLVGLSALMTTTLPSMEQTISALHKDFPSCKIMVGGAVLTADYAEKIKADFYAKDAKMAADIAKKVIG